MKRRILFVFFLLLCYKGFGQSFYNDWIDFSNAQPYSRNQYYKIQIVKEGIYRIYVNALVNAGIRADTINPARFQIFYRGEEQHILVENVNGNRFNPDGFIEFYGKPNDGWLDTEMYPSAEDQLHPRYSLISDTATYFLTWGSSLNTKRRPLMSSSGYASYTPEQSYTKEIYRQYKDGYGEGKQDPVKGYEPEYTSGEGYRGQVFSLGGTPSFSSYFELQNLASGGDAEINATVLGLSDDQNYSGDNHQILISVNGNNYLNTFYKGYVMKRYRITVPHAQLLANQSNEVKFSVYWPSNPPLSDRNAVSHISLKYPHKFHFTGEIDSMQTLFIRDNGQNHSRLSISGFLAGDVVLYDLTANSRIEVINNAGVLEALVPTLPGIEKACFLSSRASIRNIASSDIKPVSKDPLRFARFINFTDNSQVADYIILTHKLLMPQAEMYKTYRQGYNGYKVTIVDVDELYDQFGFGINKHPLSIRGFAKFVMSRWTVKPSHLFLFGKSIMATDIRFNKNQGAMCLVPTMGNPPSDNMLTARIPGFSQIRPAIPTGRLSARTGNQVIDYLQKVKEYESAPLDDWMKQVLHLGGGDTQAQQASFRTFLNNYRDIIQDTAFGGHVTSFFKSETKPEINQSDSLKSRVENGLSLITFFGHSSPTIFDYSLDDPKNYNIVPGHYSFFMANGCLAGDIHTSDVSSSENYVLIPGKGSIGFLASTYLSTTGPLNQYSTEFYRNLSRTLYGQSVGKIIQRVVQSLEGGADAGNVLLREVLFEMTLEGDPAIVINSPPKPDLKIARSNVFFTPSSVSADMTSFKMNIILTNLGKALKDSFYVQVKRIYGDNSDTTYRIKAGPVHYKDTLTLELPVDVLRGPGINRFEVFADATEIIDEVFARNPYGEMNNRDTVQLLIQSNDLIPVYPLKYGIVPSSSVTLKAITGTIFAPSKTYTFEIDTTDLFNSPLKQSTSITQPGGVVSWAPALTLKDSTVYFWRTSLTGSGKWQESSFTYIPGKKGWSQSHFFQLKNDKFHHLKYNRSQRKIDYVKELKIIRSTTFQVGPDGGQHAFYVNNVGVRQGVWISRGFIAAVYDPDSAKFWLTDRGEYGQWHPATTPGFDFDWPTPGVPDSLFAKFLEMIPNGHYVLIYSVGRPGYSIFNSRLRTAFESLGSSLIGNDPGDTLLKDTLSYILFSRKGYGPAHEVKSSNSRELISLEDSIVLNWVEGSLTSERIGPAKSWSTVRWRQHSMESPSRDSVLFDLIGITKNGTEVTLIKNLPKDSSEINIFSRISAASYPYLKLRLYSKDSILRTPSQLEKWQVFYEAVPEATINPAKHFTFLRDTLQEGEILKFSTAIENISDSDMDSLRVRVWVSDKNRLQRIISDKKRKPLLATGKSPNDTIIYQASINTTGYPGNNSLWVEINPNAEQSEQYFFNNLSNIPFYVVRDITNPLLDVTFDGVHILDGDIVSARPVISIKMNDENTFLALNDTSMFRVWLVPPGTTDVDRHRVFFRGNGLTSNSLRFSPATLPKNVAEIEYRPVLLQDGVYSLIVEGVDASKNVSGKTNYKISFEVINRSTITGFLNYPNPFSTSTRFVFTLTGYELPTALKIQILTVTGKVVREIMLNELGTLRIGRNITEYAWDGKDEFGDQLANGLYIYRVLANINGSPIEKRETSADKYFVKGYGKMYLMR
jgi:hypothetical protein